MKQGLEKSILGALAYFDIFGYPLTLTEVKRSLWRGQDAPLGAVAARIADRGAMPGVHFRDGFFYLTAQEGGIGRRQARYCLAHKKFARAKKIARIFSVIPFVRYAAVCNSLSFSNARAESDIDLFIVAKRGGVWWARFFCLLILKMADLRPRAGHYADTICLSFFADEDNLDMRGLCLSANDAYLPYWVASLYPVYDAGGWHEKVWQANQAWVKEFLPAVWPVVPHPTRVIRSKPLVRPLVEILLAPFAFLVRLAQMKKFPKAIRELLNRDSRVLARDGLLKFHTNDRRAMYAEEFEKRYLEVIEDLDPVAFIKTPSANNQSSRKNQYSIING